MTRRRLPRVFGRGGLLTVYNLEMSSLQEALDKILGWNPLETTKSVNSNVDTRFVIVGI